MHALLTVHFALSYWDLGKIQFVVLELGYGSVPWS